MIRLSLTHGAPRRSGFTLVEILVAMGIGLVIIQIAFASFVIVQKYVNRIQRLDAANKMLQSVIVWHGYRNFKTYPDALKLLPGDYTGNFTDNKDIFTLKPLGANKVRRMPHKIIVLPTTTGFALLDLSKEAEESFAERNSAGVTGWIATIDPITGAPFGASPPEEPTGDPRIIAQISLP
jgi:prepilin-type N-terminal cleavage/methylation domain-containing protein